MSKSIGALVIILLIVGIVGLILKVVALALIALLVMLMLGLTYYIRKELFAAVMLFLCILAVRHFGGHALAILLLWGLIEGISWLMRKNNSRHRPTGHSHPGLRLLS